MKSYFRFLWKNKSLTLIQVLGISIALSFAIPAVSLMVEILQMKYDNPQYKTIYGVHTSQLGDFKSEDQYLVDTYPEVEAATQFVSAGAKNVRNILYNGEKYEAKTMHCNPDIVNFFPVTMVSGSMESLVKENSIIISKEFASKLSDENMLGKTVTFLEKDYVVTGILDEFHSRKIPYTDVIFSYSQDYNSTTFFNTTFVRLKEGEDVEELVDKMWKDSTNIASKFHLDTAEYINIGFERYDKLAFSENFLTLTGIHPNAMLYLVIALSLLLLFAITNYINLSMAMSTRRAKEMATKRLLGSTKWEIWRKVIAENVVFTFICFVWGLLLAFVSIKFLSGILFLTRETSLMNSIQLSPFACLAYLLLILMLGVLTGIAPARTISRYTALDVVKGEFKASEKKFISKVLIVVQGFFTVVLLFVTILQWAQVKHNQVMDFGCDIDDVYTVLLPNVEENVTDLVYHELASKSYVQSMGYAQALPGFCYNGYEIRNNWVNYLICDPKAFDVLGFRVLEDYTLRGKSTVWLSDNLKERLTDAEITAEELAQMEADVVGGTVQTFLSIGSGSQKTPLVVVKEGNAVMKTYLVLKTKGDHREVSADIRKTVDEVMNAHGGKGKTSTCEYVRDLYYEMSKKYEESYLDLMQSYLAVMMMLSILGILGISTYNMQIRKHEISVRKVFGASTQTEVFRNTRSYALFMLIANVIGLPVAYMLGNMLQESEISKVGISFWMFLATFLFTMGVVICVCLIQSYHTASLNPVENLKSE